MQHKLPGPSQKKTNKQTKPFYVRKKQTQKKQTQKPSDFGLLTAEIALSMLRPVSGEPLGALGEADGLLRSRWKASGFWKSLMVCFDVFFEDFGSL